MREDDIDAMQAIFADPRVMDAFDHAPFDRVQTEQWVRRNLDHQREYGYGLFAVVLRTSGGVIGNCGLTHMKLKDEPVLELGYDLRSAYWGQGLATEAALSARDYAFDTLEVSRLVGLIREGNHRSRRVAEKVGMSLMPDRGEDDGSYWIYAMSRETGAELA